MGNESTNNCLSNIERITRDISDGLMLIDGNGTVAYINPRAAELLGNPALKEGIKIAEYMAEDENSENDAMYQYILDSIYEKDTIHEGTVTYIRPDGDKRYLNIDTSYAKSDIDSGNRGIILSFEDITDLHLTKIKRDDTVKILIGLIVVLAIWNYVYMLWNVANEPFSSTALTICIEVVGVIGTFLALRFTSLTWDDFGLGTKGLKKAIKEDVILTLIAFAAMVIVKLIIMLAIPGAFGADKPFIDFTVLTAIDLLYIPTVVIQEFLTRGVIQGALDRILSGDYPAAIPIVVSSLFFGALHVHKGLLYMVGATLLLGLFGVLYRRQKTIWGLCIPHLLLSWALRILFM